MKIEKQCVNGFVQDQTAQTPWIYTYYGYDANGQVMSTYTVTLNGETEEARIDEQMIYGAGRIGLIQSGELIHSTVTSIPSETAIWQNRLGKKRYELTNHLGNVNAVITDRKVVNGDYAVLWNDPFTSTNPSWSTSSGCGAVNFTLAGGTLTASNTGCPLLINRASLVSGNTEYTLNVDIVDRNDISGFSIELQVEQNNSGTYTQVAPTFLNVPNGRFSYTFTTPAGATRVRCLFRKLSSEAGVGFTLDNLYLGTAVAQYAAVPVQKMDYYPYGMEMTGGLKRGAIPAGISPGMVVEPVVYTNVVNLNVNLNGDLELSPLTPVNTYQNNANSAQVILPGEYIEFTASPDPVGEHREIIGLSYTDGGLSYPTIKYAWWLYPGGTVSILESNVNVAPSVTTFIPGESVFRIAREGGNIVYYKDGTVIRTVADANPSASMIADITIYGLPNAVPRVYKLVAGRKAYTVEEAVIYTNHYHTFTNGDGDLELSGTGNDNSATGVQTVLPGEYIEFTASPDPVNTNRSFIGLSYADGGYPYPTINYCWYIYYDARIVESGTNVYTDNTPYVPGVTKFRIERTGGSIVYYRDGVAVRTVSDANPTQPMLIDITMWNTGAPDAARIYDLVVGKLQFVVATYAIGDYVPYVHSDYRYGYQGYESDDEVKGNGNSYTTEFRQYDPRIGRWLTMDPIVHEYQGPYCGFDNNPILHTDPDGTTVYGDYYDSKTGKKLGTDGINDGKVFEISKSQWNKLSVDAALNYGDQSFQNASYAYGSKQVYGSEANAYIFGNKAKAYESQMAASKPKEMVRPENVPKPKPAPAAVQPQVANVPAPMPSDHLGVGGTNTLIQPTGNPSPSTPEEPNPDFTTGAIGGVMYLSGQPMSVLKPFGYLGSESGSSIASYTLSKALPYRSPAIKAFTRAVPSVVRGGASTAVLGRAAGRFVPVVGWGLLVWDVGSLMYTYRKEIKQGMEARQDYIDQGLMPLR